MKTTKEILYDNYDINITNEPIADCPNTKWYSEEEIMKAIKNTKYSQTQLPYKIDLFEDFLNRLLGDKK